MEKLVSRFFTFKPTNSKLNESSSNIFKPGHLDASESSQSKEIQPIQTHSGDLTVSNTSLVVEVENYNKDGEDELHSWQLLKQEFDAIHKWKVATEVHIEQKETQLNEVIQTSERQRKTILELQLENESLSYKLQDERRLREDECERMNNFRALMDAVKNHFDYLQKRIVRIEQLESFLNENATTCESQFGELKEKFDQLSSEYANKYNDYRKQIEDEVMKRQQKENDWKICTEKYEEEISQLKVNAMENLRLKNELDLTCQALNSDLQELTNKNSELISELVELKSQSELYEPKLQTLSDKINEYKAEIETTTNQNNKLNEELQSLSKDKADAIKEKEKINVLYEDLKNQLEEKKYQYMKLIDEKMDCQLEITSLRNNKIALEMKNKELQDDATKKINELKEKTEKLSDVEDKLEEISKTKSEMDLTVEKLEREISQYRETVAKLDGELKNNEHIAQWQYEKQRDIIKGLDQDVANLKLQIEKTERENDKLEQKIESLNLQLKKRNGEIESQKSELEKTKKQVSVASVPEKKQKSNNLNTSQDLPYEIIEIPERTEKTSTKTSNDRRKKVSFNPALNRSPIISSTVNSDKIFDELLQSNNSESPAAKKNRITRSTANKNVTSNIKPTDKVYGRPRKFFVHHPVNVDGDKKANDEQMQFNYESDNDSCDVFKFTD